MTDQSPWLSPQETRAMAVPVSFVILISVSAISGYDTNPDPATPVPGGRGGYDPSLSVPVKAPGTPDEQRLIEELFHHPNYDASARPVYNASDTVPVSFGFTLLQIMDMEETNQALVTTAWLEFSWVDERIWWDPMDYNGLKVIRIPADMLWLPDIVLYNNADDFTTGFMPGRAMVSHDGSIFWGPPVRLRSSCLVDSRSFPFDTQSCRLKFGSWTYPTSQMDILNMRPNVDVTRYVSNGEWQLTGYTSTRYETVYPGPGNVTYADVKVLLEIQRRTLYYVMNIIFSCIWLSILTLLDFCLPPDEGEKITLGATVLLSYAFFMLMVANSVPPSSESLPLLSVYLTVSVAVNSASLSLTMLVLKLHHSPAQRNAVPYWLQVLVLQHLARLVRCHCPPLKGSKCRLKTKTKTAEEVNGEVCRSLIANTIPWTPIGSDVRTPAESNVRTQAESNVRTPVGSDVRTPVGSDVRTPVGSDVGDIEDLEGLEDMAVVSSSTPLSTPKQTSAAKPMSLTIRKIVINQMTGYLGFLVGNAEKDMERYAISSQWKQVALVVDRFLFWIFLTITLTSTFTVLLIVPYQRVWTSQAL